MLGGDRYGETPSKLGAMGMPPKLFAVTESTLKRRCGWTLGRIGANGSPGFVGAIWLVGALCATMEITTHVMPMC